MRSDGGAAGGMRQGEIRSRPEPVYLRRPTVVDRREFVALNRISATFHRGWVSPPRTPDAYSQYLQRVRQPNNALFFVCRREDGAIVGAMNFSNIVLGSYRSAFLGYFVGRPFAGRGYMTAALRLALRRAFGRLRLHRVEANLQPGNAPSRALLRRAGFRLEGFSPRYLKIGGRWRDHERWAITAEEWRARKQVVESCKTNLPL